MTTMQLQPAGELRRPDQHGQLPHIISTTYPDRPLSELQIEDILEINWTAVRTAVRDAIVRVKHEGDFCSSTVRETIRLIALALRKLEMEDAELERVIANWRWVGFIGWLVSCTPTRAGRAIRGHIVAKKHSIRKKRLLKETREELFDLRVELAEEVDEKIDARLLAGDADYRELQQQPAAYEAVRTTAHVILAELEEYNGLERELARCNNGDYESVRVNRARKKQIELKFPAFMEFCSGHAGHDVDDRGQVEMCLKRLVAELDAKAQPAERRMAAMRDKVKQELYGDANEVP